MNSKICTKRKIFNKMHVILQYFNVGIELLRDSYGFDSRREYHKQNLASWRGFMLCSIYLINNKRIGKHCAVLTIKRILCFDVYCVFAFAVIYNKC